MKHPTPDIKKKVVAAYHDGYSITHIAKIFGFHRNSVRNWVLAIQKDPGLSRKSLPGSGRLASFHGKIGLELIKLLKQPASSFGFETDFWTTKRIQIVSQEKLNLTVSRMAIHRALVQFEYSYKKPQKSYYEACAQKQSSWVKHELVELKKIVKKKKAILYFLDEASISLTPKLAKTWGPVGKKVVQKVTGNRGSVSAISGVSSGGELMFNLHDKAKRFNSDDVIRFIKALMKHHGSRHLVVVMDQAACHKAKKVKEFVEQSERLNVFYLPPRSPEYNPDEKVWSHLKNHELKSHKAKTVDELKKLTRRKMQSMARSKRKVLGIFKLCEMSHLYL